LNICFLWWNFHWNYQKWCLKYFKNLMIFIKLSKVKVSWPISTHACNVRGHGLAPQLWRLFWNSFLKLLHSSALICDIAWIYCDPFNATAYTVCIRKCDSNLSHVKYSCVAKSLWPPHIIAITFEPHSWMSPNLNGI